MLTPSPSDHHWAERLLRAEDIADVEEHATDLQVQLAREKDPYYSPATNRQVINRLVLVAGLVAAGLAYNEHRENPGHLAQMAQPAIQFTRPVVDKIGSAKAHIKTAVHHTLDSIKDGVENAALKMVPSALRRLATSPHSTINAAPSRHEKNLHSADGK
jgi:hypothetical protein